MIKVLSHFRQVSWELLLKQKATMTQAAASRNPRGPAASAANRPKNAAAANAAQPLKCVFSPTWCEPHFPQTKFLEGRS